MQSMYHRIAMVDYRFPPGVEVDKTAKQLLSSILKYTPQSRASISQILNHPWLKNVKTNTKSTSSEDDTEKYSTNESGRLIPECDNYKFKSVNNYSYVSPENFRDINGMYTLPRYNLVKF